MATLREIKRRIQGVENIKKITNAMKVVAATRRLKIERRLNRLQVFAKDYDSLLLSWVKASKEFSESIYFSSQIAESDIGLLVVISSDRGLCGGFNNNIFTFFKENVASRINSSLDLIVVGQKAFRYFNRRGYNILQERSVVDITCEDIFNVMAVEILNYFKESRKPVYILSNSLKTKNTSELNIKRILPIDLEAVESDIDIKKHFLLEESDENISSNIVNFFIGNYLYKAMLESSLAEEIARVLAMENATDNAQELTADLVLMMNRERQRVITQEISDIVGGLEGLKT